MSKILVLGDIHGRSIWEKIVAKHHDVDKVIFIGDYVDTHDDITPLEQLQNLRKIIKYKALNQNKVVLLVGNHDYHYWPGAPEQYSGYQPAMRHNFEHEFQLHNDLFQMAFQDENDIIYTHAGVTKTWLESVGIASDWVSSINELFKFQPYKFKFSSLDTSGYGEHKSQSPIWVRAQSLYNDKILNLQIVGHTMVYNINHPPKSERRGFYIIDALGTSKEYLIIDNGKITIEKWGNKTY